MAASPLILHYPLLLLCLISSVIVIALASSSSLSNEKEVNEIERQKHGHGFSVDLIHRDSPLSPFHNSAKTKWERFNDALRRSAHRSRHFGWVRGISRGSVDSLVVPAGGEYLMNLSIGTPPVPLLGIADTGSDLTWTQCLPCVHCYNQTLPIFDPQRSSTFKPIPCGSPVCYSNLLSSTCDSDATCSYYYSYGDKSYTNGNLATETLTFGPNAPSFPQVSIGCGHDNQGSFGQNGSGLIGLGGGGLSLVSQLKSSLGAKFSYCLVPFFNASHGAASKISFGSKALVSGLPGAVSTPLVRKYPSTFYYLTLESIGVGNQTFAYKYNYTYSNYKASSRSTGLSSSTSISESSKVAADYYYVEEGNIIIDSGTTLTLLPEELYEQIEDALRREIKGEPVKDPEGILRLCYKSKEEGDIQVPTIKVGFSGAEIQLKPYNTFVRVEEDRVCFAMVPATEMAIFGNLAQMDFLVGYDLEDSTLSFKPADCTSISHRIIE